MADMYLARAAATEAAKREPTIRNPQNCYVCGKLHRINGQSLRAISDALSQNKTAVVYSCDCGFTERMAKLTLV